MQEHEEYVEGVTAGYVGAHEAVVGSPVDSTSVNVPQTRAGAAENAEEAEEERGSHGVFVAADHNHGGDVTDVRGDAELTALHERAEHDDPLIAARDAMREDLRGKQP
ncbi:hypothetical protein ACIBEJ_13340 [Nonomuraea sp. NPDC050790]|uniref:hypothetical protein n=1 Tax=Nonomuraea sp. NPDC050790 TaxID=3364371 RepID=UPI0037ADA345